MPFYLNMKIVFPAFVYRFSTMVHNYKRKSERQNWNVENMRNAIQAVNRGQIGWLRASKEFHVPQSTLRRARNKNKFVNLKIKVLVVSGQVLTKKWKGI